MSTHDRQVARKMLILTSLLLISGVLKCSAFRTRREPYDASQTAEKQDDYNNEIVKSSNQQKSSSDGNVENITVKVGQQAILPCFVNNLGSHKVIWSKDGDILTLGSTKINSDTRLNIQHRYVSEWHLVVDNVMTDDEGDYNCKTNGNFFKAIRLQVLMPPVIDDAESTPAGTITLKEGSALSLKCFAEAKPEPHIKWYRWKKYKHLVSEKEELGGVTGNEIVIPAVKRGEPNVYECIARNSVPPATSRIFNLETHFLPVVDLEPKKSVQHLHKKFTLECKISSNPIDKVYWSRNGVVYDPGLLSNSNKQADLTTRDLLASSSSHSNIKVEQFDLSDLNDNHKLVLTLHVSNPNKQDFGEYKCCASNIYGQTCEEIHVHESKSDKASHHNHALETSATATTPSSLGGNLFGQTRSLKHKKQHLKSKSSTHRPGDFNFNSDDESLDQEQPNSSSLMLNYDQDDESGSGSSSSSAGKKTGGSNLVEKDKRRHYLINSKQLLNLESQSVMSSGPRLQISVLIMTTMCAAAWLFLF